MARKQGRVQASVDYFSRALKLDGDLKSEIGIAYDLRNLGISYQLLGDNQRALQFLEDSLRRSQSAKIKDNEIKSHLGIGDVELALNDPTKAAVSYNEALALARSINLNITVKVPRVFTTLSLNNVRCSHSPQTVDRRIL